MLSLMCFSITKITGNETLVEASFRGSQKMQLYWISTQQNTAWEHLWSKNINNILSVLHSLYSANGTGVITWPERDPWISISLYSPTQKHPCNSKEAAFGEIRSVCRVCVFAGRPVMIVVEYMENGSLDSFLRVSAELIRELKHVYVCSWYKYSFNKTYLMKAFCLGLLKQNYPFCLCVGCQEAKIGTIF